MVERGKLGEVREGQEGGGEGERRLVAFTVQDHSTHIGVCSIHSSLFPSPLLYSVVSATIGVSAVLGVRETGVYDRASVCTWGEPG